MQGKHTSNLKNHLAVRHSNEYSIVLNLNKANIKEKSKKNSVEVEYLKKICMQLVTVHGRPLAMINDDAFQHLIHLAAPSNSDMSEINVRSIKAMVTEQAYNIKNKIWGEIKNQLISLKLDSVTCTDRKFIGINIQYMKNSQIVVRNLAVLEVHQSQTATFLKENLEHVLTDFRISKNHIYCVCTDNGANMIKMVKLIGGKYFVDEERNNKQSAKADNISDPESEEYIESEREYEYAESETEENEHDDIINEEGIAGENEIIGRFERNLENICGRSIDDELRYSSDYVESFLPNTDFKIRGMLCAAHTLQLAIKDAINEDINSYATINLARKVVKILRKPNNMNKLKAAKLKKPLNDCPTRWTSTYNMLRRLITFEDICNSILELSAIISTQFWTELSTLVECLEPPNRTTIELQQTNLTIGDFCIAWLNCKNQIKSMDHSLARSLLNAMEVRETKLMNNDVVLESLYLDRRINLILDDQQCEKAKTLLKQTYHQLLKVKNDQPDITSNNIEINKDLLSIPSTSRGLPALEEMLVRVERSRGSFRQMNSFDSCLNELIGSPRIPLNENIIRAWNNAAVKSSELAMVAQTVLAAPAAQVSVERLFSSLKFILNPLRSNLNQHFLRDLMLVRENKDLLD